MLEVLMLVRIFARIMVLALFVSFGIAFSVEAFASEKDTPKFRLPIDCQFGKDCWIVNYPDATAGRAENGKDFTCGLRTYKKHKGTDFAIPDHRTMREGVAVLAPKSGVISSIRDGQKDGVFLKAGEKAIGRFACGNNVVIKHAKNWQSQLCHLREGSVSVKVGDRVNAGDPIGLVGMSGKTEFPHVHFSARYKGKHIDPFTNSRLGMGCGEKADSQWDPSVDPGYKETVVYAVGFSDHLLDAQQVKDDVLQKASQPTVASKLIAWAAVYGVKPDMTVNLEVLNPKGTPVIKYKKSPEGPKAWLYVGVGRPKPKSQDWLPGKYTLQATVERDGRVLSSRQAQIFLK